MTEHTKRQDRIVSAVLETTETGSVEYFFVRVPVHFDEHDIEQAINLRSQVCNDAGGNVESLNVTISEDVIYAFITCRFTQEEED